jgi:hypothetical protein
MKRIIVQGIICFIVGCLIGYIFIPIFGIVKSLILAFGVGLVISILFDWKK